MEFEKEKIIGLKNTINMFTIQLHDYENEKEKKKLKTND